LGSKGSTVQNLMNLVDPLYPGNLRIF